MLFFKNLFLAFTKRERIAFIACSATAIASFVVVMSIVVARATVALPLAGGEYTEGMVGQPEYVNPVTAQSQTDLRLVKLLYLNIPDVSDKIDVSDDGRVWTVHLKPGITWQDGQKLTSDDIIFTVQSIQNPDANSPLYTSWQGVTPSRVSELELQFTLANPYAFFSDNLANLYIIPKHVFADIPPGNWRLSDYNLKPIGAGPYQFVSYDEQSDGFISAYHLTAWENSDEATSTRSALIKKVDLQFFRNPEDLIAGFNSGAIDGLGGATPIELASVKRPYHLYPWRTPSYYAIFWNMSKNIALQDPAVRQALVAAVNRDTLVANALQGYGVAETGPIPPHSVYFSSSAAPTSSLDPATLLGNAGWMTSNGSDASSTDSGSATAAFRSKMIQHSNVPLAINLTVPDIDYLVATAETLQSAWQSIGAQVTIATDTPANIVSKTIKNRAYEALLFGNVLGPSSDLYSFWDSSQRFSPGLNLAIYSNTRVDKWIEDARVNLSDASRTIDLVNAQTAIIADNPAIFLYSPDYLYLTGKEIGGIATGTLIDPSDISRNMTDWYLGTMRALK